MTPEKHNREDIVLVHPDEITLVDEVEARRRREKTIATLRFVWEQRRFLSKVVLWGIVASVVLAFLIPVRYDSTVRLMPPDQQSGMEGLLGALSQSSSGNAGTGGFGSLVGIAGNVLGLRTSSDLFIGILQSRTIQDDLINKFNLRRVYWDRKMEDARNDLARRTDIAADRKSGIITINVTDHDPQRAAAMGREYVEQLNLMLISLNTSAAHRERGFLEQRLKQVKQDLGAAEKNLSEFSSRNAMLDLKAQSIAMVETSATLEGQLIAAQTELQGLKQIYSDENVRVRSVQARVDELKRQIQKVGGSSDSTPNGDGQFVDSLYPTVRELPLLGVSYTDLYRETRVQEVTFEMLTREYELAKVEEAKELPSVKVLDRPDVPGKKSFPPRALIVILGTFLAFSLGVFFLLSSAGWRAIDPNDPGKLLATEVWIDVKEHAPWIRGNGKI